MVILIALSGVLFTGDAGAQNLNPVTFGTPGQLNSGSTFPVRTVASITHPDPNDATKDVIDSIDFDGDGNPDIVQADAGNSNHITVWLRPTTGAYTNVQFSVSGAPAGSITDLAVADLNNDGLPDIVVAAGGTIYLYTNDGVIVHSGEVSPRLSFTLAGTLTAQDAHGTAENFARVAAADMDGDSLPEIAASSTTINSVTMSSEGHVSVFKHAAGNNTTYNAATVYVAPFGLPAAGAIAIAPVVGADAFPDIIVCDPTVLSGTKLAILPGKGDATVVVDPNDPALPALKEDLTMTGTAIAVGDVDGDGNRDIFVAGSQWANFGAGPIQILMVDVLHNAGGAGFDSAAGFLVSSFPSPSAPSNTLATDIALGDFNLDGTLDLAVADSISSGVAVMSAFVIRDSNNTFLGAALTPPQLFATGQNVRCVASSFIDSDAHIDLVIGSVDSDDTDVLLNTSVPPAPPLTGKKIGFEFANYVGHVNSDSSVTINVNRASDSTGSVTVPFTVGGTAIPSGKANSDYVLDFPANKKVVFGDGVYQQQIQFSLSFNSDPAPPKTIIVTLGKPVGNPAGNAVLAPLKIATITLLNSNTPSIHAAGPLTVKPSNIVKIPAKQLKALGVKAVAYTDAPWTFSATQTLDKKAAGLALKVQYSNGPAGPWHDFVDNVMAQTKTGGTSWTTTSSAIPPSTALFFQTVTSAPNYLPQSGAPVGAYAVIPGPRLTLGGKQCPLPEAGNSNTFVAGQINTHNSEGITYRFTFGNTGSGDATNVTIGIPLNTSLTHFGMATPPHLAGGHLVQLDHTGKPTTSNLETAALQYQFATLSAGDSDTVDVVVDVISANEFDPTHDSASFGKHVALPAYRITAAGQNEQVYGSPALDAVIQSPLSVTLMHDTNIASPGGLITYTGTLTNTAGVDYHEASFSVKLPEGAALENVATRRPITGDFDDLTINPTDGTNPSLSPYPFQFGNLQTLTWNIGAIPAGHSVIVKFSVRVQYDLQPDFVDSQNVHHTAEVDITNYNLTATPPTGGIIHSFQNDDDGAPARVLISAYDPAALPQIGFIKVATGLGDGGGEVVEDGLAIATVLPGDEIQYDLVYFNTGGSPARGCVIQEEIASGATFVGFMNLNGTDFNPGQYVLKDGGGSLLPYPNHTIAQDLTKAKLLEFHLGDIAPNSGGTLTYRVAASVKSGNYILSNGYRMYTESLRDPRPGSPVQVPAKVVQPISFDIRTQADKGGVNPGDFVTFTVRFRNNGGIDADNLVVSSAIPPGTTFVSGSAKLANEYGTAFIGQSIEAPVAGGKKPVINFKIPALVPDEPFTDVNGNLFHETNEPFTDTNSNNVHDGEGIAQFTVQLQNPLPLSLRVPSSILENTATIAATYPSGAVVHAFDGKHFKTNALPVPGMKPPLPADPVSDTTGVRIIDPLHANLWAYKSAPHFVTKGQRLMYKVLAGNSGNIPVNNVQAAIQVPFGTTLDAANTTPGYKLAGGIVTWKLGNLPAHGVLGVNLFVIVGLDASYKNDLLEENSCSVKSLTAGGLQSNAPEVVPGPSRTTVLSTNPVVATWQSFCAWLGSLGGNVGHNSGPIETNVHALDEGTLQVAITGVDVVAVQNGAVLIQNGGGNIVAAGAGNIVAAGAGNIVASGAGNIVAAGAGNIVASGAGNLITVSGVGLCTQANLSTLISSIVASGAGNIVAAGGGNLIAQDGASLLGLDGAPLIGQDGSGLKLTPQQAGIVAAGAGNIVAAGAGNIVAAGAGNIVASGAGNIVASGAGNLTSTKGGSVVVLNPNGAGLVAVKASGIVAAGAGNIVSQGAGNIVAAGAGN